ncbi:MAG: Rpn family recombination-promoting nuclease/putative transposase [Planctomycetota bacterium]
MEVVRTHDALFRFVFEQPEQMAELLQSQLPPALVAAIDCATLRRLDGTFVDKALQGRVTDLLFEAQLHGAPLLLHVVVDHKSRADWATALQMARYTLRIHDRWLADHPDARRLPPVLPFVVHHGDRPWQAARSVDELVDLDSVPADVANVLRPLQLRLPFVLLDLATLDEAAIDGFRLSVVSSLALRLLQFVRRLDPAAALAQMRRWAPLLKQLLAHLRGKDVVHALLWWYSARVGGSPEGLRIIMTKLQEDDEEFPAYSLLDFLLDEGREQGMKKGIQQGEHLGMRQLLESLLRTRFGVDPAPYADRLAAADLATMQSWGERLLRAPTIEQVFA